MVEHLLPLVPSTINMSNHFGVTPLFDAIKRHHLASLEIMVACSRVDINSRSSRDGYTALHYAAVRNNAGIAFQLIYSGKADLLAMDHQG